MFKHLRMILTLKKYLVNLHKVFGLRTPPPDMGHFQKIIQYFWCSMLCCVVAMAICGSSIRLNHMWLDH